MSFLPAYRATLKALEVLLLASALLGRVAHGATIADTGQPDVGIPGTSNAEFSGLTRATGDLYYAVDDEDALLYELEICVDLTSGFIEASPPLVATPLFVLAGVADAEEVVFHPDGTVFVADERIPAIAEHSLADGSALFAVPIPSVFDSIRTNQGFEALALEPSSLELWTANEAALTVDGPLTDEDHGMFVRLQRFDANLAFAGQWAYLTEPLPENEVPVGSATATGVVDLLILPSGELLAMERHLGSAFAFPLVVPFFRITIAQVRFDGATDVSALPRLDGAAFVPVAKTVLWQDDVGLTNFESMALGPELANGDYSLLLLAEGGALSDDPVLRSLRVTPAPEPSAWLLGTTAVCVLLVLRHRSSDGSVASFIPETSARRRGP